MAVLRINRDYIIIGGGVVLLYILTRGAAGAVSGTLENSLASFIPSVEGFSATPYWDINRYSWGYGTAAPGSTGTISRDQAFSEMFSHLMADYSTLSKKITRSLNVNQWTALLSFSYNLGVGNAENLITNINAGDDDALQFQWNQYIHAGGQVNSDLVTRRQKEWSLWVS